VPVIPPHVIESIRTRTTAGPRSILTFLYLLYGTLMTGSVVAVGLLVDSSEHGVIPYIAGFMALLTVGLIVAVLAINSKNPGSLLLADVSAREYLAIRTLTQGDDVSGETVERILGPAPIEGTATESTAPQLEPPTTPDHPRSDPSPGDET
jgi:hypothetical protein